MNSNYVDFFKRKKTLEICLLLVPFGWLLVGVLMVILRFNDIGLITVVISFLAAISYFCFRFWRLRCPKCGKLYFFKEKSIFAHPYTSNCLNCGLEELS